jgi:hypothetical protein
MGGRGIWAAGAVSALLACSGAGTSQSPIQKVPPSELACLVTLSAYCCGGSAPQACIGDFASATRCSSWPAGTSLMVYPTPCQGMTAVRIVGSYSTFYVFDSSGALLAVGDNSVSPDPRSGAIGCGAGPSTFVIPTACGNQWQGTAGVAACSAGSSTPASVCH